MTDHRPVAGDFETRREAMLGDLVATMQRLHRRRRIRRRVVTAAAGLTLAAASTWLLASRQVAPPTPLAPPTPHAVAPAPSMQSPPAGRSIIRRVGLQRTGQIHSIDDDELIARLAEIDRPTGLIRAEGRVWLTEAVVDDEPSAGRDQS